MDAILLGARLVLALVFAVAGVTKLMDLAGSRRAIVDFGVPATLAGPARHFAALAELAIAAALLPPRLLGGEPWARLFYCCFLPRQSVLIWHGVAGLTVTASGNCTPLRPAGRRSRATLFSPSRQPWSIGRDWKGTSARA